ncbi:imidazole glycerol phosphate synthase subunit HisH [Methylotuvimicrobium sp.]|uniref:imidazole glycerol phosphate synthase subunit HisH n=1 Tax=Methylotuvimicrobium sp. TaxID=2822413 RepID=UPI003D65C116
MITLIDYGMGNLGSIQNMLRYIGVASKTTSNLDEIKHADKIILPGVGAFDKAMEHINSSGLREVLEQKACVDKIPVLGICLGMQLLTRGSEEGVLPGLGWIAADTRRFPNLPTLKVPHMGWNLVYPGTATRLTRDFEEETRFYFVHSYYVTVDNPNNSILKTQYGIEYDSAIQNENIYGVQFHPEKSHRFGMRLLKNFAEL